METINKKHHLLAVYLILRQYCDKENGMSISEISQEVERKYRIRLDRNTIADDISTLSFFFDVEFDEQGEMPVRYYWTNREFDLDDIQQLIFSVQVNADLPPDQKVKLISKATKLLSEPIAKHIKIQNAVMAQLYDLSGETEDRVEELREHIKAQSIIRFYYPRYEFGKNVTLTSSIRICYAFPLEITYVNRKPILCAYLLNESEKEGAYSWDKLSFRIQKLEGENARITFFNIDLMNNISVISQEGKYARNRDTIPNDDAIAKGIESAHATLYHERTEKISIQCSTELFPIIADYFDNIIAVTELTSGFRVTAETAITPSFIGWVFSLGSDAKLTAPPHAVRKLKQLIMTQAVQYNV